MKIREIILDTIINTTLFEMADERNKVIQFVRSKVDPLILHLVKIYMFGPESGSYDYWCREINGKYLIPIKLAKCKHNNKPLDKDTLKKILFDVPLGHTNTAQEWMEIVLHEEDDRGLKYDSLKIYQPDGSIIHKQIESTLESVCITISNGDFRSVKNYIDFSL